MQWGYHKKARLERKSHCAKNVATSGKTSENFERLWYFFSSALQFLQLPKRAKYIW